MARSLEPFAPLGLDEMLLALLVDEQTRERQPRLAHLWSHYRNPASISVETGETTCAQSAGLPNRLRAPGAEWGDDRTSREIVIENDIAWRIHALVDFMFGKPVRITSQADDEHLRRVIERVLDTVIEASGGIKLLQDTALLGSVYGCADLLLRCDALFDARTSNGGAGTSTAPVPSDHNALGRILAKASLLRIETVEATRSIPLLNTHDYRELDAYILHFERELNAVETGGFLQRLVRRTTGLSHGAACRRAVASVLEIISADHHQIYEDDELICDGPNPIGRVPVVHIQNLSQPYRYDGLSEVEPLIPLQDELNTRLSDRANRVTLQSFRMYLGKGIDGFTERPIGPGQMWTTDNPDASIEAFGGDANSPSEESHIREIREAMDKTSAVSPLAAGLIRTKIGNLSSENAMRITLMGLLAKTNRKRVMYGRGLADLSELILHSLDVAGVLHTDPADRRVEVVWPNPLPDDASKRLTDAKLKLELGVARDQVLAELGYAPGDAGIT
ncbi:MAG: phage portal protein [Phycisphaerales bacterium]|nr:phage portal protein [Phycisphaerales bacterium]